MLKLLTTKYKLKKYQIICLGIFVFVALFHQFIAHENKSPNTQKSITTTLPALIPYASTTLDSANRGVGPFDKQNVSSLYYRHWLGTDTLGRDVLAGLIDGSYVALKVGFWSGLLGLILGLFFGFFSGYFGDKGFKMDKRVLILNLVIFAFCFFYAYYGSGIVRAIFLIIPFLFFFISSRLDVGTMSNRVSIPFDILIQRLIEIFRAVPSMFLILVFLALFIKPAFINVILVIAFLRWPVITRHIRAEILKLKEQKFILSSKAIGQKDWKIFKNHILPLCISPITILVAFGFSAAILTESTLSFLGIGIPIDQVTWGSMLSEARKSFQLWWLAVFPGLMIYFVIALFNSLGDSVSAYFQRSKKLTG